MEAQRLCYLFFDNQYSGLQRRKPLSARSWARFLGISHGTFRV